MKYRETQNWYDVFFSELLSLFVIFVEFLVRNPFFSISNFYSSPFSVLFILFSCCSQIHQFSDAHRSYLTNLPNFNALTSNIRKEDFNNHKPYATRVFNVLMAGTRAGTVQLFVFGMLASGQINVRQTMGALPNEGLHISDVRMSPDFSTVLVWINFRGRFQQLAYTNPLFANNDTIVALLKLTARYGYIVTTQSYIEEIVQCMLEAWETAKQEMERKLETYVNSRPRGVVSADFLNLLMFGEASDNLEDFLENDLTAKGMKRLENSIDITYSTIQKLVVQPLHCAILNMSYHLNYLKGMSKNAYYYKVSTRCLRSPAFTSNPLYSVYFCLTGSHW